MSAVRFLGPAGGISRRYRAARIYIYSADFSEDWSRFSGLTKKFSSLQLDCLTATQICPKRARAPPIFSKTVHISEIWLDFFLDFSGSGVLLRSWATDLELTIAS